MQLKRGFLMRWILALTALLIANSAFADCAGQFTPVAGEGTPFSQVHFFPKNGNKITISGREETIPPGIGVISGGVVGTFNNASIEKTPGQTLKPLTLYFLYVFMDNDLMKMDFSPIGHREDPNYGHETHAADPTRSLVGMVRTNSDGKFVGNSKSQLTLSWCNRVSVGLTEHLEGLKSSSTTLAEANPEHRLEWLQWGINDQFTQGADVPNLYLSATVKNSKVGSYVNARIAIDGQIVGNLGGYYQVNKDAIGMIHSSTQGWGDEGYHYGQVFMDNGGGGGEINVISGMFFTSPLRS
jgi:hypothetical protein